MDENIAPQLEELTKALGDLEKNGIRAEFEKLINFRVPPEIAKESILRKFEKKRQVLKIKELSANIKGVEISVRLLDLQEKALSLKEETKEAKEGSAEKRPSRLYTGILADETGSIMFSSWKELECEVGDALKIRNASTRLWQNRIQLSIGEQAVISKIPASDFPPITEISKSPVKKLLEIGGTDFLVSTVACVLRFSLKEIMARGKQTQVISGVLADETGRLPFTAWIPLPGIDIGSFIRIEEAQVRMYLGGPSINILSSTKLSLLNEKEIKKLAFTFDSVKKDPPILKIRDLETKNSMFDIAASGNVVSVRPGSGIIFRCPECGRVIQKGNCRVHGKVKGVRDMRIKAVLDDGTGTMSVTFSRELAELIYGKTLEEAEELMFSDISKDAVYEDLRRILTGRYLAVRGNSALNEYGLSFVAESAWVPEEDLAIRLAELLRRLGSDKTEDGQINSEPDATEKATTEKADTKATTEKADTEKVTIKKADTEQREKITGSRGVGDLA